MTRPFVKWPGGKSEEVDIPIYLYLYIITLLK